MQILPTPLRRPDGGRSLLRDWDRLDNEMQRPLRGRPLSEASSEAFVWAPQIDFTHENGAFERSFTLPSSADLEDITAEFNQGVLRIRKGKRAEARGKKIEVNSK